MNDEGTHETKGRSRRWEEGITRLALERGGSPAIAQRAITLTREMNIAPWLGLAVAERLVELKDASVLDRASRCKELQAAVLDGRMTVDRLRVTWPFAPHLLAVELLQMLPGGDWTQRELTGVLQALLKAEERRTEDGEALPVRTRSLDEYAALIGRMARLMRETRCGLAMAMDMALGRVTELFVREYTAHRRRLARESQEQMRRREYRPYPARRDGGRDARGGGYRTGGGVRRHFRGGPRAGTAGS